ncbi:hypothetical protein HanRHA438_Chr16g0774001 [Helianthus annuus]|nr:hypothetical protein HanRHA438_Chr16g0774001 [Helianthus annuus]
MLVCQLAKIETMYSYSVKRRERERERESIMYITAYPTKRTRPNYASAFENHASCKWKPNHAWDQNCALLRMET